MIHTVVPVYLATLPHHHQTPNTHLSQHQLEKLLQVTDSPQRERLLAGSKPPLHLVQGSARRSEEDDVPLLQQTRHGSTCPGSGECTERKPGKGMQRGGQAKRRGPGQQVEFATFRHYCCRIVSDGAKAVAIASIAAQRFVSKREQTLSGRDLLCVLTSGRCPPHRSASIAAFVVPRQPRCEMLRWHYSCLGVCGKVGGCKR